MRNIKTIGMSVAVAALALAGLGTVASGQFPAGPDPARQRAIRQLQDKGMSYRDAAAKVDARRRASEKTTEAPLPVGDPKVALSDYVEVRDEADLLALSNSLTSPPVQLDYSDIARSSELQREFYDAKDGFAKQKIVDGIRADLEQKIGVWKRKPYFRFTFGERSGPVTRYDFATGGFLLTFRQATYQRTRNATDQLSPEPYLLWAPNAGMDFSFEDRMFDNYRQNSFRARVSFSNADKFCVYKAPDEARARELDKILEHNLQGKTTAYCFGQRGRDGTIYAQIMKFVVADKTGRPLFEM
jgi:hypothetical protein